jgi:GNAT superfamily N-acetyltransferase
VDRRPAPDAVRALFERLATLPAVVACVIEGRLGRIDGDARAARLSLGCYEVFAGDPSSESARDLLEAATRGREIVYGNDPAWRRRILDVHGARLTDRPMEVFDGARLQHSAIAAAARAPEGYSVTALDVSLASQLDGSLAPHGVQTFASAHDLVTRGLAVGATAGGELVCAATSYAISARTVEVAIATRERHRGRGLAHAVAAAFLDRALRAGLVPHWSAANPVSKRLARRLGLAPRGSCEAFVLR